MGCDKMESNSEQQQRPHSAGLSVNMGANSSNRLFTMMVKRSMESFDTGVSFKIAQPTILLPSKSGLNSTILRSLTSRLNSSSSEKKHTLPDLVGYSDNLMTLRRPYLYIPFPMFTSCNLLLSLPRRVKSSSSEKSHVVADDEDLVKSPYSLMVKRSMESNDSGVSFKSVWPPLDLSNLIMAKRRMESFDSGMSFKGDQSKNRLNLYKRHPLPIGLDLPSSEEKHVVADDEDWIRSPYSLMAWGSMESLESNDSGVSFKTDQSKDGLIDFKDGSSPRSDFSSSEEEDVVSDDEDFFESSDDLGRDDPGVSGLKWDGNIIEAPVSSCF